VLGARADKAIADNSTVVPFDGAGHQVFVVMAAPPAWLDGAGSIIAEGLYLAGIAIVATAAPTAPGIIGNVIGPFFADPCVPADAVTGAGFCQWIDVVALGVADVPFPAHWVINVQTDLTGTWTVIPFLQRLAS